MTIGVYGLVAGIVKLDDAGLHLSRADGAAARLRLQRALGRAILVVAPYLMKTLSVLGTAAMFMVGGGILVHGIPAAQALVHDLAHHAAGVAGIGGVLEPLAAAALNAVAGVVAGAVAVAAVSAARRLFGGGRRSTALS
jgi:hypothetical protein